MKVMSVVILIGFVLAQLRDLYVEMKTDPTWFFCSPCSFCGASV